MLLYQPLRDFGVVDRRSHLEPVPDDPRVSKNALHVPLTISCDPVHIKSAVGGREPLALLEDRLPGQPRLIDLQNEALKDHRVVPAGKAVLRVVVGDVDRVRGRCLAIIAVAQGTVRLLHIVSSGTGAEMRVSLVGAFFIALGSWSGAAAQTPSLPTLDPPQLVAKNVTDVNWAPESRALAYVLESKSGKKIGVFDLDHDEGAVVRSLSSSESVQSMTWLAGGKSLLVVIKNSVEDAVTTIEFVDAARSTCKPLWTRRAAKGGEVSVEIDQSPLLVHALVRVRTMIPVPSHPDEPEQRSEAWVLTSRGESIVYSSDLTLAEQKGMFLSTWSRNGTAIYAEPSEVVNFSGAAGTPAEPSGEIQVSGVVEFRLTVTNGTASLGRLLANRLWLVAAPPLGSTVLECVPANGVLRTVRFEGAFEPVPEAHLTAVPLLNPQLFKMGASNCEVTSLWLVPPQVETEGAAVAPTGGVLVSAQAEAFWSSPSLRAIAFTWNGALFVRAVRPRPA